MTFKKWPSIENTYREKFIAQFLDEFPELADETYIITEKLHGSNIQVYLSQDHDEIQIGSRNQFLKGNTFQGANISDCLEPIEWLFSTYMLQAHFFNETFRFFGELIGPGVQHGVDYGNSHRILFFGMMKNDMLLPYEHLIKHIPQNHIVPFVTFANGLQAALDFDTNFPSQLNPVEGNTCEGVVIQPYNRVYQNHQGQSFILKEKNPAFLERHKTEKRREQPPAEIVALHETFLEYITEGRLQNVFSKIGTIEEPQQIGDYIRAMLDDAKDDFLKDYPIPIDGFTKDQLKQIFNAGHIIARMLKKHL